MPACEGCCPLAAKTAASFSSLRAVTCECRQGSCSPRLQSFPGYIEMPYNRLKGQPKSIRHIKTNYFQCTGLFKVLAARAVSEASSPARLLLHWSQPEWFSLLILSHLGFLLGGCRQGRERSQRGFPVWRSLATDGCLPAGQAPEPPRGLGGAGPGILGCAYALLSFRRGCGFLLWEVSQGPLP